MNTDHPTAPETAEDDILAALPTARARDLWSHHRRLRGDRLMPTLQEFLDKAPVALMPYLAIGDVHSPTRLDIRFFGTQLTELFGRDARGQSDFKEVAQAYRGESGQTAWRAARHPAGYLTRCIASLRDTRVALADVLTLPLASKREDLRHLVKLFDLNRSSVDLARQTPANMITEITFVRWLDLGAETPPA